jgi:SMODS-associating 2TM, beta-strand rich effector domain
MHDYSIDKHPKEKVLFVLAFIAITLAPIIQNLAERAVAFLDVSSQWSSAPAVAVPVFSLFAIIYILFDRFFWKFSWLRKVLLVPDLNGTWKCLGHTTLQNGESADIDWSADISITQSWSKILIHLRTSQSESKSISASLFHENGVGFRLLYLYDNKPDADELDLKNHSGCSELLFNEAVTEGKGSYYTDRHRTTVGTMSLTKDEENGEA